MVDSVGANSGKVIQSKGNPNVREVIKTQNGTIVEIPVMMGSSTHVKPLKDGTYQVTTRFSCMGAEPETKILTEDELIAKYGPKTGQKLQLVA